MSSCKHEIPVLAGFLTKQVVQIPEKTNCTDLCLFKNSLISSGSKLQFKVQKICTTTRACLFPDTLYSLIPHNEGQLERLFYFASVFHVHWLSASFTAAGTSAKLHRSAPHHQIHSESTKICSQAKKNKCICKCLSSFPLHPSLEVHNLSFAGKPPSYSHYPSSRPDNEAWQHFLSIIWSCQSLWLTHQLTAWTHYTHRNPSAV